MITLLRLRADHFKGLRALDLNFPRTGSLLIEGHNEAGKSTLFEAVFVALYGKALVGEDDARPRLEDLIAFDAAQGWVELTFEVGATHVVVAREFSRTKPQVARITVAKAGQADETRHGISAVNDRILREIGGLDADALRNSCFVEQKELGRLESLRREDREKAIERLLGLDRLTKLAESYKTGEREADDAERRAVQRLELAQAVAAAREANTALALAREQIDATQARIWFATLADLDAAALQGEQAARQYSATVQTQQARLDRASQLDGLLRDIDDLHVATQQSQTTQERTLAALTTAQQALPAAERQVALANEALDGVKRRDTLADLLQQPDTHNDATLGAFAAQVQQRSAEHDSAATRSGIAEHTATRRTFLAVLLAMLGILLFVGGLLIGAFLPLPVGVVLLVSAGVMFTLAYTSRSGARQVLNQAAQELQRAQAALALAQRSTATAPGITALTQLGFNDSAAAQSALTDLANRFGGSRDAAEQALITATAALAVAGDRVRLAQSQLQSPSVAPAQAAAPPREDVWQALLRRALLLDVGLDAGAADRQSAAHIASLREHTAQARATIDTASIARSIEQAHQALGAEQEAAQTRQRQHVQLLSELNALVARHDIAIPATLVAVADAWPLFAATAGRDIEVAGLQEREAAAQVSRLTERAQVLAQQLGLSSAESAALDRATCEQELRQAQLAHAIAGRARQAISLARQQVVQRVLPVTERNMRSILPLLTAGRYHDVRLTPPDENGSSAERADYRIYLYERSAGRYVAKSIFSGGARDQCSLALRLAFALATLPQELGIAPGFLFLDEPLSAFDNERGAALVELLTQGMVANTFSQVVVISHQHAYSAADFRYHVRMERGRIVASDLPDTAEVATQAALELA